MQLAAAVAGNSFLFTGREYDWETGLYHYRSRAYDPTTGSFLQEDPLGMRDGVNVVAYVSANPINLSDPFGTAGIGEAINNIMNFINENRTLVADLLVDLMGPLEGVLDLISAVTGKDVTGWIRGGMNGSPDSMGWWDRAVAAAGAAVKIASGGLRLLSKLKGILRKIEKVVEKAKELAAKGLRKVASKLTGGCFVAATLVLLTGGDLLPIESFEDPVLVQSGRAPTVPVGDVVDVDAVVVGASRLVYEGAIITLVVDSGEARVRVSGTPEHPFWCVNRHSWVPMGDLAVGDELDAADYEALVVGREVGFANTLVHNLAIDGTDSFRVTQLGLLVHNTKRCPLKGLDGKPFDPSEWKAETFNSGPATNKKWQGGTTMETKYVRGDETWYRHTVVDRNGKVVHDHFRPYAKPSDAGADF